MRLLFKQGYVVTDEGEILKPTVRTMAALLWEGFGAAELEHTTRCPCGRTHKCRLYLRSSRRKPGSGRPSKVRWLKPLYLERLGRNGPQTAKELWAGQKDVTLQTAYNALNQLATEGKVIRENGRWALDTADALC